jgi:LPXTG-motif cell wall-anchored protein
MTRMAKAGLIALLCAAATIWLLPSASLGRGDDLDRVSDALRTTNERLAAGLEQAVAPVLESTAAKTKAALQSTKRAAARAGNRATTRATATDPARQPPLHGTNPHAQGGVAVVDLGPSNERPLGANPDGSDSNEEVVVGRPRGEQQGAGGAYHGHITILALFGRDLLGVDTAPGETKNGPLQPLQEAVLDPVCRGTGGDDPNSQTSVCLSVLTANSTTSTTGSQSDFAVARAKILGLGVGAAESTAAIGQTADCQSAVGSSRTANVVTRGGQVAAVANSATTSQSCRGQASKTTTNSEVIELGGTGLPLPAAGCANGTPDTVVEIPLLARLVCNADEVAGAAAVREALDVFALNVGATSLVKETTAATEALTVAPAKETTGPECSDGVDNDGDGVIDAADPGCHTDGNPKNPASYNPNDTSEEDAKRPPRDEDDGPDDEDGRDGGPGPGGPGTGPGEAQAGGPGTLDGDGLPLTGTNVVGLGLAGLLLLAGGLLLRRREEAYPGA